MTEKQIAKAFADFMEGKGLRVEGLSLSSFPGLIVDYYRGIEFAELKKEEDGDLLLFQYGIYDWGKGSFFEVDFTRQYYESFPETDDHSIFQQSFTFYFDPAKFSEVPSFNIWSNDCADLQTFENAVTTSAGYMTARRYAPTKFETSIEDVC